MNYKGYIGTVSLDEEADLFHGHVVNTRDVITFQGKSFDEICTAFQGFGGRIPEVLRGNGQGTGEAALNWQP